MVVTLPFFTHTVSPKRGESHVKVFRLLYPKSRLETHTGMLWWMPYWCVCVHQIHVSWMCPGYVMHASCRLATKKSLVSLHCNCPIIRSPWIGGWIPELQACRSPWLWSMTHRRGLSTPNMWSFRVQRSTTTGRSRRQLPIGKGPGPTDIKVGMSDTTLVYHIARGVGARHFAQQLGKFFLSLDATGIRGGIIFKDHETIVLIGFRIHILGVANVLLDAPNGIGGMLKVTPMTIFGTAHVILDRFRWCSHIPTVLVDAIAFFVKISARIPGVSHGEKRDTRHGNKTE